MHPRRSKLLVFLISGVAGLAAAVAIGYAIGHRSGQTITVHRGIVYETANEGTASAGGWNYFLPVDVNWIDSQGTLHDGSERPSCIRLGQASRVVFGTVKYTIAGSTVGTVVWIQC